MGSEIYTKTVPYIKAGHASASLFVQQIYSNEDWINSNSNGKSAEVFPEGAGRTPMVAYFFESAESAETLSAFKLWLRESVFKGLNKASVHITDTAEEAVAIAELVLNENSLKHLDSISWSRPDERKKAASATPCRKADTADERDRYYFDQEVCKLQAAVAG